MDKANVSLEGRLTRDPIAFGEGEKKRVLFTVASNDGYGDSKNTVFVDCIAWSKRGDIVLDNFKKGSAIQVDGKLEPDNKPDSDDKSNKTRVKVFTITAVGQLGAGLKNEDRPRRSNASEEESAELPF